MSAGIDLRPILVDVAGWLAGTVAGAISDPLGRAVAETAIREHLPEAVIRVLQAIGLRVEDRVVHAATLVVDDARTPRKPGHDEDV